MSILTNQLGLNLSENKIQLVEIVNKDNTIYLENVDQEYYEESIFSDTKEAKFIHILQNAYNEIVLRKPVNSSKISIALSPNFFKIFELPVDKNLTKNDVDDYIKWELSKLFPAVSGLFSFQKIVLHNPNYEQFKSVLVIAIEQNILKRIHKFCVRNNLKLQFIDNAHFSSSALLSEDIKSGNYLSINVEDQNLSTILFSNGNLIKHFKNNFTTVVEIPALLKTITDQIVESNLVADINKLFIFGNSATQELINEISTFLESDIEKVDPFQKVTISNHLEENNYINNLSEQFSAAASISYRIPL